MSKLPLPQPKYSAAGVKPKYSAAGVKRPLVYCFTIVYGRCHTPGPCTMPERDSIPCVRAARPYATSVRISVYFVWMSDAARHPEKHDTAELSPYFFFCIAAETSLWPSTCFGHRLALAVWLRHVASLFLPKHNPPNKKNRFCGLIFPTPNPHSNKLSFAAEKRKKHQAYGFAARFQGGVRSERWP